MVAFRRARHGGLVGRDPAPVGFGDCRAQRLVFEDFLKSHDIGIHGQQLVGQPVLFPGEFLGRVALKPVIFPAGADQVLDVERGS